MTRLASRHLPATAESADWRLRGACSHPDLDPDTMFAVGGGVAAAKRICHTCPVKAECLADALDAGTDLDGVWGETDRADRRRILHGQPQTLRRANYTAVAKQAACDLWAEQRHHYAADGACARAIAKQLDIAAAATVLTWVRAAGVANPLKSRPRTPDERAAAVEDYERLRPEHRTDTAARDAVALLHGVAPSALRGWLAAAGVIDPQPRTPRGIRRQKPAEPA